MMSIFIAHLEQFTHLGLKLHTSHKASLQLHKQPLIKSLTIGVAVKIMTNMKHNLRTIAKLVNGKTNILKVMLTVIPNMATIVTTAIILNKLAKKKTTSINWPNSNFL